MPRTQTTFCRICENQCGLKVTIEGNDIVHVEPDTAHIASRGFACNKGLNFHQVRNSPDRITTPLKKVNGEFVAVSWELALSEIGSRVRQIRQQHGNDSVGLYFGNPIAFSPLMPILITGFTQGLGTSKLFTTGSLDCNNKFLVNQHMYGSAMALTYPDVDRTKFLVLIGSNPAISKMSFINLPDPVSRLKAVEQRGGRVVHINPRRTETAKSVGEQVFIRPDTDVFFLLAFLNEVIAQGGVKQDRVREFFVGYERVAELVRPWTPEKQAEVTGIAPGTLRELVQAYLAAEGAALYASTGINQGSNGSTAFWIMEVINAVTGNLDRPGGVLMGQGIIDYAKVTAKADDQVFYSRIGNTRSFLGSMPTALMADEILQPGGDQIRAMFCISGNPALTATASDKLAVALDKLELLVSIDLVRNETAEHADYILPGTHFSERPDLPFTFLSFSGAMPEPWIQYTEALVSPPGQCRDEAWILSRLAEACDAPLFGSRVLQGMIRLGERAKTWPWLAGRLNTMPEVLLDLILRIAKLGGIRTMKQYDHGRALPANLGNNYLGKRVVTPGGRVHLSPPTLLHLARARLDVSYDKALAELGRFKLITKRERFSHNSWAHNDPAFVKGKRVSNYLYMHPDDAERLGLEDGQPVAVESLAGRVTVPVSLSPDMMPGSVALPHGWGHQGAPALSVASKTEGVNANVLTLDGPEHIEPISGMCQYNGIVVDIRGVSVRHPEPEGVPSPAAAGVGG